MGDIRSFYRGIDDFLPQAPGNRFSESLIEAG
jgi:hypothetical protein